MMTRQDVVRAIRLLSAAVSETSPRKLAEELEMLAKMVEVTSEQPTATTTAKRTNREEMFPATDKRVAGMLAELHALIRSRELPEKNQWFVTQYLGHKNFSVKGVQKVLATAKAAIQVTPEEQPELNDQEYCNLLG